MRPYAVRILAPNPSPYTLEGTNTWIVGTGPSLVIDPGPDDPGHLAEVRREAGDVGAILLTHRHPDHAPGAERLAAETRAPVMAFGSEDLREGQAIEAGGVTLVVIHTPGHATDHVAFHDMAFGALFTGDAVLGRGTSIVDPPEGDMAAYVDSLERMLGLAPRVIYPGHGTVVWDGMAKLQEYLEHRRLRERQVLEALGEGPRSPRDVVPAIYSDHPDELRPAAARTVLAHLLKLEQEGRVVRHPSDGDRFGLVEEPAAAHRSSRPRRPRPTPPSRSGARPSPNRRRGPRSSTT